MLINNLPEKWDLEADVVAIGSGIGGLSAAIAAHEHGASAMVLERSAQVGGVTALSLGEVWIAGNHHAEEIGVEDSPESGFRYLKRLAMGYGEDVAMLNLVTHARVAVKYFEDTIGLRMEAIRNCPDYYYGHSNDAVAEGRLLEVEPFEAQTLGEWQAKTRISPLVPYSMTHHDIFSRGGSANMAKWDYELMAERITNDIRCLGAGLAAYFVKGALDRNIPMMTGVNVVGLIGDGERVAGVHAIQDGKDLFVKANKGVVIAVSSYERNQNFNKTVASQLELESMVFSTVDGAHFRMAGPFGGRVARVPDITALGFHVPGEEDEEGKPLYRSALQPMGLPHVIVVNRAGKRFANEAFYRDILFKIDQIAGSSQTHPNFPCWAILDSQQREKYPFATIMPEQDLPEPLAVKADSLTELAAKTGIDAASLEETVARFNHYAEKAEDPDFGRGTHVWSAWMCGDPFNKPHPNLGTIVKPPFYAVAMHRFGGSAIAAAGLLADHHCRAIGWDDQPIPGLYVAGNSVARMDTGATMQSGVSNARGMTHGYLAGRHAAGQPSELLEAAVARGALKA